MGKLTVKRVAAEVRPGMHGDGDGLYLAVASTGAKSWILRTRIKGQTARREIGLGSVKTLTLAEARAKSVELRKEAAQGKNPITRRDRRPLTFEQAAREVHQLWAKAKVRNPKHEALWISSLEMHIFPAFGAHLIDSVTRPDVVAALTPHWSVRPDTARRLKQRIGSVFAWAIGAGHYSRPNPVDDALKSALPSLDRSAEHMAALPWRQLPDFMQRLSDREAIAASALRFLILTAARSGECRGARWSEIDLDQRLWEIPKERMKMDRPHRVPLSPEAVEILEGVKGLDPILVFPSPTKGPKGEGRELSVNAFRPLLDRMKVEGITVHGFRSAFRDWSSESAKADRVVAEAALAHVVRGVEAAYARSDLLDRRRSLMTAWATFCVGSFGQVVQLVRV